MCRRQNADFKVTLCILCLLQTNEVECRKTKESGLREDESNVHICRIDFISEDSTIAPYTDKNEQG